MTNEVPPLCAVCLAHDPSESWLEPILCVLPLTEEAVREIQGVIDANNRRLLDEIPRGTTLDEPGPDVRWIPMENLPADDPVRERLGATIDELAEFGGWAVIPLDRVPNGADADFPSWTMMAYGHAGPEAGAASSLAVFEAEESHVDNTLESEVVTVEDLEEWRMLLKAGLSEFQEGSLG